MSLRGGALPGTTRQGRCALSNETYTVRQCGEQSHITWRLLRLRTGAPRSDIIDMVHLF
jgi:hypothetical protein